VKEKIYSWKILSRIAVTYLILLLLSEKLNKNLHWVVVHEEMVLVISVVIRSDDVTVKTLTRCDGAATDQVVMIPPNSATTTTMIVIWICD